MLKLYFSKPITTVTTLLTIGLILYIVQSFLKRSTIEFWGRRILLIAFWGLLICITAATRDAFHHSVQYVIDGSTDSGLFTLLSTQSIVACVFGTLITIIGIVSIFVHKQNVRQVMFFMLSFCIFAKLLLIEVSRIAMYISNTTTWKY